MNHLQNVREDEKRNRSKMVKELSNLQKILDSNYQVKVREEEKKKKKKANPVKKLSSALFKYKTERIGTEDSLI